MKIKICTCKQCKAKKKTMRKNTKKRIRRYLNRCRRKNDERCVINWYYA